MEGCHVPAKWSDISDGFDFVSSGDEFGNEAFVSKETGEVFMRSDYAGDLDELPDDIEGDGYVALPHKRDLDLGGRLVDRFAEEVVPEHADNIRDIFAGKGAYRRLKNYLDRAGQLDRWYEFETVETEKALRAWCEENGIALAD
jgi:hypothetical protein